jgi:hypothetical protein
MPFESELKQYFNEHRMQFDELANALSESGLCTIHSGVVGKYAQVEECDEGEKFLLLKSDVGRKYQQYLDELDALEAYLTTDKRIMVTPIWRNTVGDKAIFVQFSRGNFEIEAAECAPDEFHVRSQGGCYLPIVNDWTLTYVWGVISE